MLKVTQSTGFETLMKETKSFVKSLLVCAVAVAMATSLSAQTAVSAKVVRIQGNARYTTGNNVWLPLKVGLKLKAGTVVQTAQNSKVDLVLGEGEATALRPAMASPKESLAYQPSSEQDTVRIFENSVLGVDKLTTMQTGADVVSETQLDLRAGRIMGNVKKMSAASKYEVKLPNGVAGIRGTIYWLSAEGVIKVLTGSVVLAYVGSDGTVVTQVVMGGQQFDARTGQLTQIPEADRQMLGKEVKAMGIGAAVVPTTFAVDHTVYFVSPTIDHHVSVQSPPPGGG